MTLNLMVANRYGAWLSADFRISDISGTRVRIVDDESPKWLHVMCGEREEMVIVYAGIGAVNVRGTWVHVSDWMRHVLRGENRGINGTVEYLAAQAEANLGPIARRHGIRHGFNFAIFSEGRPFWGRIHNSPPDGTIGRFENFVREVPESGMAFGAGAFDKVSPEDVALLKHVCTRKPRKPDEFNNLLFEISLRPRRSWGRSWGVSP